MIDFQYHTPNTLEEVFDLLNTYGEDARVMAGGTALVIQMKQRLLQPEHVINLRKIAGLSGINKSEDGIQIGSLCTQRAVETDPLVSEIVPLVANSSTMQSLSAPSFQHPP